MSYEFAKKEIGDYRITIYQDEDAECPCKGWDLVGVYFWDYSDNGYNRGLSRGCSSEVDAKNAEDALKELVCKYVSQKKIIDYINSENVDSFRMRYDKSEHMWYLENLYNGEWYYHEEFCPSDLKRFDYREELCDILEERTISRIFCMTARILHSTSGPLRATAREIMLVDMPTATRSASPSIVTRTQRTGESEPWTYLRMRLSA